MAETAKTVTETVVNKNTVKLALDEYNDLIRKAARPVVNNVTVLQKTAQQAAEDNVVLGIGFTVIGLAITGVGIAVYRYGKKNLK